MQSLRQTLKKRLKGAKKIAVLGIGSELRADDSAGILVAEKLKGSLPHSKKIRIFLGATAPENLTGEIKRFKPTHVVIIDSADLKKKAGHISLLDEKGIGGISFCTHRLPLRIMAEYLAKSTGCEVMFIGIQPKKLDFEGKVSAEIEKSVSDVAKTLLEILK